MPVVPHKTYRTTLAEAIFKAAKSAADAEHLAVVAGSAGYPKASGSILELAKKPVRWSFGDGSALIIEKTGTFYIA